MTSLEPILIVGAGPSGLVLAIELQRRGVPFRIVERLEQPSDQSRALGLTARTLETFAHLGVIDAITGEAKILHGFNAYSDGGALLARLDLDLDSAETHHPHEMVLPQNRTVAILAARLERLGGGIERGTEVIHIDPHPNHVAARLMHASSPSRVETLRCSYVVGADGANSIVRRLAGINFEGMSYEERFLLADARVQWPLRDDEAHLFLRRDGPIVAFPYPTPGRWRLIDTSGVAETGDAEPTLERFRALFGEQVPGVVIDEPGWTSLFRIHRRLVDRYRAGRLLLLGDAAHIHSPASGQGLNTGVGDAFNLGWKLALVAQGHAPDKLLDSVTPERRPAAEEVLKDSNTITQSVLFQNAAAQHLRDWAVGFALSFDRVQRRLSHGASKLGVSYHGSPIVDQIATGNLFPGHPTGPTAGDRAPDVALAEGRRLYDVFGETTGFHLLIFAGRATRQPPNAETVVSCLQRWITEALIQPLAIGPATKPTAIRALADSDATIARAYGIAETGLVLVRPDLHIGFKAEGLSASPLVAHLDRIMRIIPASEPTPSATSIRVEA